MNSPEPASAVVTPFVKPAAPAIDLSLTPDLKEVFDKAATIAKFYEATVYISGPTGSGKNTLAQHIHSHENSSRRNKPFVTVNLANVNAELVESQLFGHKRGSFTGAVQTQVGTFQEADGGTIFLDEVAELPPSLQARLLRVLDEKKFRPVGGDKDAEVDVRIIVATSKNLEEEVKAGKFREDLYHRINQLRLHVPPLCERPNDIPLLAEHFARTVADQNRVNPKSLTPKAIEHLKAYEWPGNVRELAGVITRGLLAAFTAEAIGPEHIVLDNNSTRQIRPAQDSVSTKYHDLIEQLSTIGNFEKMDDIVEQATLRKVIEAVRNKQYHLDNAANSLGLSKGNTITYHLRKAFDFEDVILKPNVLKQHLDKWTPASHEHEDLTGQLSQIPDNLQVMREILNHAKIQLIRTSAEKHGFDKDRASEAMGTKRRTLDSFLQRYGLQPWWKESQLNQIAPKDTPQPL